MTLTFELYVPTEVMLFFLKLKILSTREHSKIALKILRKDFVL